MIGWALRFVIAAMAACVLALAGVGGPLEIVLKLVVVVLLALCSVSLIAAYGRSR